MATNTQSNNTQVKRIHKIHNPMIVELSRVFNSFKFHIVVPNVYIEFYPLKFVLPKSCDKHRK